VSVIKDLVVDVSGKPQLSSVLDYAMYINDFSDLYAPEKAVLLVP
jgi:hypothetical protein